MGLVVSKPLYKMKNYYQILEIEPGASKDEIKKAYLKMAKKYHPDINKEPTAEQDFKNVSEAYENLKDGNPPLDPRGGVDFFNQFRREVFRPEVPQIDPTIQQVMNLSFIEAALGCVKTISVVKKDACPDCKRNQAKQTFETSNCSPCNGLGRMNVSPNPFFNISTNCPTCGGSGKRISCEGCSSNYYIDKQKSMNVTFPPGIDSNQILRVSGEGNYHYDSDKCGDLFIRINIAPHNMFKREGIHIYSRIDVDYTTCLLGGVVKVETIHGEKDLEIPYCSQPGSVLNIKGAGIKAQGNHYFTVNVGIPKLLNKKEKKLLEKINIMKNTEENKEKK